MQSDSRMEQSFVKPLSDGYRNIIKIVTDIAVKMCILNPYLGKDTLKETPGVVIIDKLDLSLHPTWQKQIVRILKELFPKIQFICATHSPFIIQSLEHGELIALDEEKAVKKEKIRYNVIKKIKGRILSRLPKTENILKNG